MVNGSINKIGELVASSKNITIALAENPSVDTMAAALSLFLSLKRDGKEAGVVCVTLPTVGLGNLVGIDKVKTNHAGRDSKTNGLLISLPYAPGEIEKISYDIVGDRINLTVVAGPSGLGFTQDDITIDTPSSNNPADLIVAIGIEDELMIDAKLLENPAIPLINIDNKVNNTGFGSVAFINPAASLSELAGKLLRELGMAIDVDIAQNLLSGIVEATNNFQKPDTTSAAFELAGFLMQKGAQREPRQTRLPEPRQTGLQPRQTRPVLMEKVLPPDARQKRAQVAAKPKDWFEPKIYRGSTPVS